MMSHLLQSNSPVNSFNNEDSLLSSGDDQNETESMEEGLIFASELSLNTSETDKAGTNSLSEISEGKKEEENKEELQKKLLLAIKENNLMAFKSLIEKNIDLLSTTDDKGNAIIDLIINYHQDTILEKDYTEIARYLICYGVPQTKSVYGSALGLAESFDNKKNIVTILKKNDKSRLSYLPHDNLSHQGEQLVNSHSQASTPQVQISHPTLINVAGQGNNCGLFALALGTQLALAAKPELVHRVPVPNFVREFPASFLITSNLETMDLVSETRLSYFGSQLRRALATKLRDDVQYKSECYESFLIICVQYLKKDNSLLPQEMSALFQAQTNKKFLLKLEAEWKKIQNELSFDGTTLNEYESLVAQASLDEEEVTAFYCQLTELLQLEQTGSVIEIFERLDQQKTETYIDLIKKHKLYQIAWNRITFEGNEQKRKCIAEDARRYLIHEAITIINSQNPINEKSLKILSLLDQTDFTNEGNIHKISTKVLIETSINYFAEFSLLHKWETVYSAYCQEIDESSVMLTSEELGELATCWGVQLTIDFQDPIRKPYQSFDQMNGEMLQVTLCNPVNLESRLQIHWQVVADTMESLTRGAQYGSAEKFPSTQFSKEVLHKKLTAAEKPDNCDRPLIAPDSNHSEKEVIKDRIRAQGKKPSGPQGTYFKGAKIKTLHELVIGGPQGYTEFEATKIDTFEQAKIGGVTHEHRRQAIDGFLSRMHDSPLSYRVDSEDALKTLFITNSRVKFKGGNFGSVAVFCTEQLPSTLDPIQNSNFSELLKLSYESEDNRTIKRIFGENLPLDKCYVNLSLVKQATQETKEKAALKKLESDFIRRASYEDIYGSDEQALVPLTELFKERPEEKESSKRYPKRILIRGRAAIGKTTLSKKIVYDFMENGLWSDKFTWLIWVPLRNLRQYTRGKRYTLCDLLYEEYFRGHPQGEILAKQLWEIIYSASEETVYLIDGWDEIVDEINSDDLGPLLKELLVKTNLISTSRPYATPDCRFDLELEIIGFSRSNVHAYLEHVFSSEPDTLAEIKVFLERNTIAYGIANVPIQLDMLCASWDVLRAKQLTTSEHSITMTQIYQAMVQKLWIVYLLRPAVYERLKKDETIKQTGYLDLLTSPADLDEASIAVMAGVEQNYLEMLAFRAMKQNRILFDKEFLKEAHYALKAKQTLFLTTIDKKNKSGLSDYYFSHLTLQEFFAARYIINHLNEMTEFITQHKYNPRYEIVWWFVAGLLKENSAKLAEFYSLLLNEPRDMISSYDTALCLRILEESYTSLHVDGREELIEILARRLQLVFEDQDGGRHEILDMAKGFVKNNSLGYCNIFQHNRFITILLNAFESNSSYKKQIALILLKSMTFIDAELANILFNLLMGLIQDQEEPLPVRCHALEMLIDYIDYFTPFLSNEVHPKNINDLKDSSPNDTEKNRHQTSAVPKNQFLKTTLENLFYDGNEDKEMRAYCFKYLLKLGCDSKALFWQFLAIAKQTGLYDELDEQDIDDKISTLSNEEMQASLEKLFDEDEDDTTYHKRIAQEVHGQFGGETISDIEEVLLTITERAGYIEESGINLVESTYISNPKINYKIAEILLAEDQIIELKLKAIAVLNKTSNGEANVINIFLKILNFNQNHKIIDACHDFISRWDLSPHLNKINLFVFLTFNLFLKNTPVQSLIKNYQETKNAALLVHIIEKTFNECMPVFCDSENILFFQKTGLESIPLANNSVLHAFLKHNKKFFDEGWNEPLKNIVGIVNFYKFVAYGLWPLDLNERQKEDYLNILEKHRTGAFMGFLPELTDYFLMESFFEEVLICFNILTECGVFILSIFQSMNDYGLVDQAINRHLNNSENRSDNIVSLRIWFMLALKIDNMIAAGIFIKKMVTCATGNELAHAYTNLGFITWIEGVKNVDEMAIKTATDYFMHAINLSQDSNTCFHYGLYLYECGNYSAALQPLLDAASLYIESYPVEFCQSAKNLLNSDLQKAIDLFNRDPKINVLIRWYIIKTLLALNHYEAIKIQIKQLAQAVVDADDEISQHLLAILPETCWDDDVMPHHEEEELADAIKFSMQLTRSEDEKHVVDELQSLLNEDDELNQAIALSLQSNKEDTPTTVEFV
jgi:hypothetical protein